MYEALVASDQKALVASDQRFTSIALHNLSMFILSGFILVCDIKENYKN